MTSEPPGRTWRQLMPIADRMAVRTSTLTSPTAETGVRWANELGTISDVKASWQRAGYCHEMQFTLSSRAKPGRGELSALARGRAVVLHNGLLPIWAGRVQTCEPQGRTINVTAVGWATAAATYPVAVVALDNAPRATTALPASVDAAIATAISRGWPITVPTGVTLNGTGVTPQTAEPLSDLLDRAALAKGVRWGIDERRRLVLTGTPTRATTHVIALERGAERTSPEYASDLVGVYKSSETSPVGQNAYASAGNGYFPRSWRIADLTKLGNITAAAAKSTLQDMLRSVAPLPPAVTGTYQVGRQGLVSLGGINRSPSRLRPGDRQRLQGTLPGVTGQLAPGNVVEVDIEAIEWDATPDLADITPVGGDLRRDLRELLEAPEPTAQTTSTELVYVQL